MKKSLVLLGFAAAFVAQADTITLECERFKDTGGWSIDSQFRLEMGSTYLLAHGMGVPVADAKATFEVKAAGEYTLYARTRNWTLNQAVKHGWPKDRPTGGRFCILVNGEKAGEDLPGADPDWAWQKVGTVALKAGANEVALRDLDGFDGRCDAVCFTT